MLNYITIILTYIALSAEVSGETACSGANQPAGAATGGAEGVRMMVTVRVAEIKWRAQRAGVFLRRRRENFGILSRSKGKFNENLCNSKL